MPQPSCAERGLEGTLKSMEHKKHNALRRAEKTVENILDEATRLPLAIRRAIVLGGLAVVILLIALLIVGIASCAGGEESANVPDPTPGSNGAQGAAQQVMGNAAPVENNQGVSTLEDPEDPNQPDVPDSEPLSPEGNQAEGGESGEAETPAPTDAPIEETPTPEPTSQYTTLKKHDKSDEVTELQKRLMELGYLDIDEPGNYYGSSTEYAVELFQRQHGLTQDGVAGNNTQTLLYSKEAEHYCLKEGAEGRDVKQLQQQLCDLGYLDEKDIDHVYGETTKNAIISFQKRNKLTDDGLAGEKTLEKLYSDDAKISSSLQKAQASASAAAAKAEKEANKKKSTPTPKPDTKADKVIKAAKSKLGCEYILGDRGPDTFDCSGFIYWCLRQAGVSCTRLNAAGFSNKTSWTKITSISDLEKGDLIFFKSDESSRVSHCGIYVGSGDMIDASSSYGKVVRRPLSSYWKRNFVCGRRPW